MKGLAALLRRFGRDDQGVAAVETALVGTVVLAGLLNVVEVGRYAYTAMQVTSASQAGAHAVIVTCKPGDTPVTAACPEAAGAVEAAIEGTSLGGAVTLNGPLDEGWYCLNETNALQKVAPATDPKPVDCDAEDLPTGPVSLYVRVRVVTPFEPIFPGLTIVESFPETITKTAWMRVL